MSDENHTTEVPEIIALTQRAVAPQSVPQGEHTFIVVPHDHVVEDLEKFRDTPARKRGSVRIYELESFNRYVKMFAEAGTQIFTHASAEGVQFIGVINYHESGKGGSAKWGDHRAHYIAEPSIEWNRWKASNNKWMNQEDFATFIEDNLNDIATPPGAFMLEIALTLQAKKSVEFKSGVRLQNGDHQLKYTSETKGNAGGNGELEIPNEFQLGIPPFLGGPRYSVGARLRYRINEGHLSLRYELIRPHKVIEAAFEEMRDTVQQATGIEPFISGAPEALS